MKKILSMAIICSMLCSYVFSGTFMAFAINGAGTQSDPYIITTASELSQIESGRYYKLGADLTVTSPITGKSGFNLDGNNHTITLDINGNGLFPTLTGEATIKNLILEGKVNSTSASSAALIGKINAASSKINISDVINYASVTSTADYTGSFVGLVSSANNHTLTITNCENHGKISGANYVGGFVGCTGGSSGGAIAINSSYNYGEITGTGVYIAGFISIYGGSSSTEKIDIIESANYGKVYGDYIGGFAAATGGGYGAMEINIKKSFNAGLIQNRSNVKRQAAFYYRQNSAETPKVTIEECFNCGDITNPSSTNGYFTCVGTVKNSYNAGGMTDFAYYDTVVTENFYYIDETITGNTQTASSITADALKRGLPSGFSTEAWEYVTNSEATENYSYPQLKSNRIYFGYKTIIKDTNTYNIPSYSLTKGTVTGSDSKPFKYSEKFGASEFSVISALGTYKGLGKTDIVYGNTFSIDKSAIIYIASIGSAINSQGFTPVLSTDGTNNAYVYDKYGVKYYLSSKSVLVENGTLDITTPSGTLGVFVGWLDNAKITVSPSENGKIFLEDAEITSTSEKTYLKGQEIKLTLIPTSGYYLKALNVNSNIHTENIIDETDIFLTLDSDISVTLEFNEYKPELKFEVLRETNGQGTIDQKVKLSGNAYDFMAGKVVTLEIFNGQNTNVLTENATVGGDGKVEIVKLFTYPSDNYVVKVKINNLTFIIEDDSNNGTYYIPTITAINNLLTSLNGDTALINKTELASDIETDKDLNFDVNIYKNLSTLKNDIVTRFLAYNDGAYTVDNIPERFATSVILSVMNSGTAKQIKSALEYYENDYLHLKDETVVYAEFETLDDIDVYSLMTKCKYTSLPDVAKEFKNSVIIGLLKEVFNSGNYLPILLKYNKDPLNILNIPEIKNIDNYTSLKQRKALAYLAEQMDSIYTHSDLEETLEYIVENINKIVGSTGGSSGGGGGGGGITVTAPSGGSGTTLPDAIGKTEDVTSKYGDVINVEETNKPTGELVYYNDFSEETVGEFPLTVSVSGNGGTATIVEDKEKGICLKTIDTGDGYEGVDVSKQITPVDEPVAYETEFKWLSGSTNVGIYLLMGNNGANAFDLSTNTANTVLTYAATSGTSSFPGSTISLKKGEWYKVRIIVDIKNQTANLLIKSDAFKDLNENSIPKSYTYDKSNRTITTGLIQLKGTYTDSISRISFKAGRYKSEFLISYMKVEKNPTDLLSKVEVKAPDAPTVSAPQPHAVEDEINVKLNGEYVYSYIKPIMRNDRVLVSVRNILEMFKMEVLWDEATQTVTAKDENNTVILKNNDVNILVNGETKTTDVPAGLYGDRIYVPLRFLSECFGMAVDWEQETQTVIIEGGSIND